jgi:hypothetical protein
MHAHGQHHADLVEHVAHPCGRRSLRPPRMAQHPPHLSIIAVAATLVRPLGRESGVSVGLRRYDGSADPPDSSHRDIATDRHERGAIRLAVRDLDGAHPDPSLAARTV